MSCVLLDIPNYSRSALARPEFDYGTLWFPENPVPQVLISDVVSYLYFDEELHMRIFDDHYLSVLIWLWSI